MLIPCPACGTEYNVDIENLAPGTDVKCPKCLAPLLPKKPSGESPSRDAKRPPGNKKPGFELYLEESKEKKSSSLMLLLTLLAVVFIIAASVFYMRHTDTPKYAVTQALKGLRTSDLSRFETYVDIPGVSASIIDNSFKSLSALDQYDSSRSRTGEFMDRDLFNSVRPRLIRLINEQIVWLVRYGNIKEVDTETAPAGAAALSLSRLYELTGAGSTGFRRISYSEISGNSARVGLVFHSAKYDRETTLDVELKKSSGYWKVAEVTNLSALLADFKRFDIERMAELNAPIIMDMERTLKLESIYSESVPLQRWSEQREVLFELTFTNLGDKVIDKYSVEIICSDLKGNVLKVFPVTYTEEIEPGATVSGKSKMLVDETLPGDIAIFEAPSSEMEFYVNTELIEFSDGSELKLYGKEEPEETEPL